MSTTAETAAAPARVVTCDNCGAKNRVAAAAAGHPRCGRCQQPLPWIVDADDSTFGQVADAATVPVLVDVWAPWCGPCRQVTPALEALARENAGRIKLVKVNADESPQTADRFQVQAIPTLLLMRNGAPVARQVGAEPAPRLRRWLEQALTQDDQRDVEARS
jgi:thioredoxin 2